MTDRPFSFRQVHLALCAASIMDPNEPYLIIGWQHRREEKAEGAEACHTLYRQFVQHFHRPAAADLLEQTQHLPPPPTKEWKLFLESVKFVHKHNSHASKTQRHQVTLNQFSDRDPQEIFRHNEIDSVHDELLKVWETEHNNNNNDKNKTSFAKDYIARLEDKDSILAALASSLPSTTASWGHSRTRHNSNKRANNKKKEKTNKKKHHSKLRPLRSKEIVYHSATAKNQQHAPAMTTELDDNNMTEQNAYESYLNWASEDNPDGVGVVHPVVDQGACGSCWAFSATGTVEASASRRAAEDTFEALVLEKQQQQQLLPQQQKQQLQQQQQQGKEEVVIHLDETTYQKLWMQAQNVERDVHARFPLSAQELLDCDSKYDLACSGGNPMLAFAFIHRYGLTTSMRYPYVGKQQRCHSKRVADAVASVRKWGVLAQNHENNMELVLKYIGPIAAGINGADLSFLSYKGGIFDSEDCSVYANHAVLIVGYGQEEEENGNVVKYWIARNSWGTGWGEDGYVRIKRGNGTKGDPGVCGIARTPSVALGGYYLDMQDRGGWENDTSNTHHQPIPGRDSTSHNSRTSCSKQHLNECSHFNRLMRHQYPGFIPLCLFLAVIVVAWPIYVQRIYRQRRLLLEEQQSLIEEESERRNADTTALLSEQAQNTYGSST